MKHIPCLLDEVLRIMNPQPGERFVDCTIGRNAGHSFPISQKIGPTGFLIGIDLDGTSVRSATEILKTSNTPSKIQQGNFADIDSILNSLKIDSVDAILADLGFSSEQMADESRGFSFASTEPPRMLLDPSSTALDASEILMTAREEDLANILWNYGEEKLSRRIARTVVRQREKGPMTCKQLADLVERIYPKGPHRIHPATRTFMALRIAVNRELENLERFLPAAFARLKVGGRLGVITYHSKEAALTKQAFRRFAGQCVCPPRMPICACGARKEAEILTGRQSVQPTQKEIDLNARSRSAQLRALKRILEPKPGGNPR